MYLLIFNNATIAFNLFKLQDMSTLSSQGIYFLSMSIPATISTVQ